MLGFQKHAYQIKGHTAVSKYVQLDRRHDGDYCVSRVSDVICESLNILTHLMRERGRFCFRGSPMDHCQWPMALRQSMGCDRERLTARAAPPAFTTPRAEAPPVVPGTGAPGRGDRGLSRGRAGRLALKAGASAALLHPRGAAGGAPDGPRSA